MSEWQESHFKTFLYKDIFWTEHGAHKYVTSHGDEWKCLENRRLTISAHNLAALQLLSATQQLVLIRQQAFHGEIKTRIIDSMHLLLYKRGTPTCIKEKDCELEHCVPGVQMSNSHLWYWVVVIPCENLEYIFNYWKHFLH